MRPKLVRCHVLNKSNCLIADVVAEEIDLLVIGGGVAGYVAAIKAGQEGLKVILFKSSATTSLIMSRLPV